MGFRKFLLVLISINTLSQEQNRLKISTCPGPTLEVTQLVQDLGSVKAQLSGHSNDPVCTSIGETLGAVGDVLTGPRWRALKEKIQANSTSLEGEELESVSALVQSASQSLTEGVAQLAGNRDCIPAGETQSVLKTIAEVTSEVSSVAGSVTGPYGALVSVGGQLLSSVLVGIDNLLQKGKLRFKNRETELSFLNLYCSYAEVQKSQFDYLNIESRKDFLEELRDYLNQKIVDLKTHCPECKDFAVTWQTQLQAGLIRQEIESMANIVPPLGREDDPSYLRCHAIETLMFAPDSPLERLKNLFKVYSENISGETQKSYLRTIVDSFPLAQQKFPRNKECNSLSFKIQVQKSKEFNAYIRDEVLALFNVFESQKTLLRMTDSFKYVQPLVQYTERSLDRLLWLNNEYLLLESNRSNPNKELAAGQVDRQNQELNQRIQYVILPQYLRFLKNELSKNFEMIEKDVKKGKIPQSPQSAYTKKFTTHFQTLASRIRMMNRLCRFDYYMMAQDHKKKELCQHQEQEILQTVKHLNEALISYSEIQKLFAKSFLDPFNPLMIAPDEDFTFTNRVADINTIIKAWNDQGDKRWCLRPNMYSQFNQPIPEICDQ